MPRGRPRKRMTRMDAAVDAMARFGFPEGKVRRCVGELLEAYGGEQGWPFIEEYCYSILIEALLRDDEEKIQQKVVEDGKLKDKSFEDERDERLDDDFTAVAEYTWSEVIRSPSDIHNGGRKDNQDQTSEQIEETTKGGSENGEKPTTKSHHPSRSLNSLPTTSRLPCYGWIESDGEDLDDFIFLEPASPVVGDKAALPLELSKSERKRKYRWDEKPDESPHKELTTSARRRKSRWDEKPDEILRQELSKPERKRRSRWDQTPYDS